MTMLQDRTIVLAVEKATASGNWIYGEDDYNADGDPMRAMELVYSHAFARALWGDEMKGEGFYNQIGQEILMPAFRYHLQQMVIADDPIKYLGENL